MSAGGIVGIVVAIVALSVIFIGGYTAWWVRFRRPTPTRTDAEAEETRWRLLAAARSRQFVTKVASKVWPGIVAVFLLMLAVVGPDLWWVALVIALGAFALGLLVPFTVLRWVVAGRR